MDENGRNDDYEALNERLTLAIVLGLSFGDILLMPATAYNDFKSNALKKEYAPTIARNILERSNKQKVQSWVKNMPPESMCKLLDCLSQPEDESIYENVYDLLPDMMEDIMPDFATNSYVQDHKARERTELLKAQAIVQIMQWLVDSAKSEEQIEQRRRQFEESLIRMGEILKRHVIHMSSGNVLLKVGFN